MSQQLDVPEEAHDDDFDPDAAKEEIEAPVTRRGDIWKLGRHRLMCGDATSLDDAEILMAGNKLDLVITDPPYNVDYGAKVGFLNDYLDQTDSRTNSVIENDHMDAASFYSFLLAAFQAMNDAMRTGAAIYVFHAESTGLQFRQAYSDAGLKLAQCLIWEKTHLFSVAKTISGGTNRFSTAGKRERVITSSMTAHRTPFFWTTCPTSSQ